ncbi:retrovirus-related pol polyprotein from transposon TNT 1-94 [Tanacetum coccineum]
MAAVEVPQTLEYRGGQLNAALVLEVENFTNSKKRFMCHVLEEGSSDDNEMVEVKVLMALAEENDTVSKEGDRNGEWVKISMRKCNIRKPIWYLDNGCSRHMTGVKSYLHKYKEQPGPKVVFGDDSTCTTEGYGSIEFYIHNHKDHLGKFNEKANDGYLLGYSLVSKAFRVFNTRRQQTKETYHITFDESPDAIKFSKPLVDNINIVENERYPPDEYHYPYVHSQRYQTNRNDVPFIEPYECPEPVVLETEVSSDLNGQTGQNAQSVQIDEILNDDHPEHSNHTNDKQIIDNLPNTKDVQIFEHSSSPRVEDTSVQNTIPILNPPLPIPSVVTDCVVVWCIFY